MINCAHFTLICLDNLLASAYIRYIFVTNINNVSHVLYSHSSTHNFEYLQVNNSDVDWLKRNTVWSAAKENIFFVHGYAAGDNSTLYNLVKDGNISEDI